jgi:hypothetical protein
MLRIEGGNLDIISMIKSQDLPAHGWHSAGCRDYFQLSAARNRSEAEVEDRVETLIAAGGWKHQRLDGDRDNLGNPQALTNIDIVQIANLDTIHCNDIAINLQFVS